MVTSSLKKILPVIASPILSDIHKYKDMNKGESCYLIGDGVSVKWYDLKQFSQFEAIPCGFLPFHNDFDRIEVNHLILSEPWWFYPIMRTTGFPREVIRNEIQSVYREVISSNENKNFFINLSNYPVIKNKNVTYLFQDIFDKRLPHNFISKRINSMAGSMRTSIMLAAYLGFDHCYLVGYDYTHFPSRSLHWYEKGEGVFVPQPNHNADFLKIAKEFIDITTITLDGASETLQWETYEEHTGVQPIFKENTELLSNKYLSALATWPGYQI